MNFLLEMKKLLKNKPLCILSILVLLFVIYRYNNALGNSMSYMTNSSNSEKNTSNEHAQESSPSTGQVEGALPAGMNSGPGSATGLRTVTSGVPQSCMKQQVANPSDLLPRDSNSNFAGGAPNGSGELANINLLKAGQLSGVDTVGSSLRNANLQVRSEPPNPRTQVSPWANSTIEPDLMRVPLELGCGGQ